jgi:hypothetical protein
VSARIGDARFRLEASNNYINVERIELDAAAFSPAIAPTQVMAPEYDPSTAEVSGPVALRSVSQVDRLSFAAALLKRL